MDEELALATLLSIDSRQYQHDTVIPSNIPSRTDTVSFWKQIHKEFPGSIPADIIFLLGDKPRLDGHPGLGWAPLSWDATDDLSLPEPPISRNGCTDLIPGEGLVVNLPGILFSLSSEPFRRRLVGMDGQNAFYFHVNSEGLDEWYNVASTTRKQNVDLLAGIAQRKSKLAMILTNRPGPQPSIGLLVEIYEAASDESEFDQSSNPPKCLFKCQVIRQVQIHREPTLVTLNGMEISHFPLTASGQSSTVMGSGMTTAFRSPQTLDASHVPEGQVSFGEWTLHEQKWIVDGFHPDRSVTSPGATDGWISKTLDTGVQSRRRASPSPLTKAWSYWNDLNDGNTEYQRLSKTRAQDLSARLIDVSFLTPLIVPEPWDLRQYILSTAQSDFAESPSISPESHSPMADTPSILSTYASRSIIADASDLAVQAITGLLEPQQEDWDQVLYHLKESFRAPLIKLVQFYAVVLWYSAYEAWESQLALIVKNNVHKICDALENRISGGLSQVRRRLEPDFGFDCPLESHLIPLLGRRLDNDMFWGLKHVVLEQNLSFAIHVQDEGDIQECERSKTQNTHEFDDTGMSPIQLAKWRVDFLERLRFPEPIILKSLRILQRISLSWPLNKTSTFIRMPNGLSLAIAERVFGPTTRPAHVPEDDDNLWNLVTGISDLFAAKTALFRGRFVEVYSWEVLDLLLLIKSLKSGGDNPPQQEPFVWTPVRILSELASTVTMTGAADSFEVGTCGDLLFKLWKDAGLDALRLIAAGAFLRITAQRAYDTQEQAPSLEEINDYIIDTLRSQGFPQNTRHSAEGMVVDALFGDRAEAILSNSGERPIFPSSTTSNKVLAIRYPSSNAQLQEALAWACAALRPNPSERLGLIENSIGQSQGCSHLLVLKSGYGDDELRLWNMRPIEYIALTDLGSHHCWTTLFAPGLFVPHKWDWKWGKGLRMSFEMMVDLSASESYIWIDDKSSNPGQPTLPHSHNEISDPDHSNRSGGYILSGYRTALIPISISNDGTEIQWHLETSDDWSTIVDHTNLRSLKRDWLKVQDTSVFENTTCYIGWYEEAVVLLGTESVSQIPSWSGARTRHRSLHPAGMALQGGLSTAAAPSPVNAQMSVSKTYNYVNNVQKYKPSKEYNGAIRSERGKTALVVDLQEKRAYLVPKLSLVLHLCRVEALRNRQPTLSSGPEIGPETGPAIPAAMPSVDGCQAAMDFFEENEETIFIGSENSPDETTLRQLFLQIHAELVKAAGLRESPTRNALLKPKVFATEIRGLLERPDAGTPLSVIKDSRLRAWTRLAALADAVCICSGLGAAIRPVTVGDNQNCECHELPNDRYLLAAHMTCLKTILERQNCKIEELGSCGELDFGEGYKMRLNARRLWTQDQHEKHDRFWKNRAEIIQMIHNEGGADGKLRKLFRALRNVFKTDRETDREADQQEENTYLTGAVVFGKYD